MSRRRSSVGIGRVSGWRRRCRASRAPPGRLSGAATKKNVQRPSARQRAASARSRTSRRAPVPSVGSRRRCSEPTAGSPGTTSTAGLSQHSAAGWAFQTKRAISSSARRPAKCGAVGVGRPRRPVELRGRRRTQPVRTHQMSPTSGSTPCAVERGPTSSAVIGRGDERVVAGLRRGEPAGDVDAARRARRCRARPSGRCRGRSGPSVGSCVRPPQKPCSRQRTWLSASHCVEPCGWKSSRWSSISWRLRATTWCSYGRRPNSGGSGTSSGRSSGISSPVRHRRRRPGDPLRGDEVDRAEHVVAAEHVPRVAQAEAGDLRQVVVVGQCVDVSVASGPVASKPARGAAANVWTGHMSWSSPHAVLAVEVPAHEAVDVDERVAVDDHPADRLADRVQPAAVACRWPSIVTALDPAVLARRARPCASPAARPTVSAVAAEEAVGDRVAVGAGVGHGEEAVLGGRPRR